MDGAGSTRRNGHAAGNAKTINLALQGGGAHGAFAWGVIDRLLEDESIQIEGIVGTSAGAMNAAVTAYGLSLGGNQGAREMLRTYWRKISDAAKRSPLQPSPWDKLFGRGSMDHSPGWMFYDSLSRLVSPYQLNPMNLNPLRDVLAEVMHCDALNRTEMRGHITRFSPAAGSEFAVIKADNSSGNFTKVAQRIPVRIEIDDGQDLSAMLAPGMSVTVSVDTDAAPSGL